MWLFIGLKWKGEAKTSVLNVLKTWLSKLLHISFNEEETIM